MVEEYWLVVAIAIAILFMYLRMERYVVVCSQDDFTAFSGRKAFMTYDDALKFAESKADHFDYVFIEHGENQVDVVRMNGSK